MIKPMITLMQEDEKPDIIAKPLIADMGGEGSPPFRLDLVSQLAYPADAKNASIKRMRMSTHRGLVIRPFGQVVLKCLRWTPTIRFLCNLGSARWTSAVDRDIELLHACALGIAIKRRVSGQAKETTTGPLSSIPRIRWPQELGGSVPRMESRRELKIFDSITSNSFRSYHKDAMLRHILMQRTGVEPANTCVTRALNLLL